MYIYGKVEQYTQNEKWRNINFEKRLEDLALKRALSAWKEDAISKRQTSLQRQTMKSLNMRESFLKGLRTETPDVQYKHYPSPEFKPGNFYVFPSDVRPRSYSAKRKPHLPQMESPRNQLCNKMRRRIFCEVIQEEKLCLDCNSRKVRSNFNDKINNEFPYLEYDRVKRPYGFCPRAIRLTEPLSFQGKQISWHKNCDCTRIKSAILPDINQAKINGWFDVRPYTT